MADGRPDLIFIAGPTASGKSALALSLAEKLGGTVVNADSMQVYRDLHILSSRPSAEDEARAPHLLYGHVDAAEPYSAARYRADVETLLREPSGRPLIFAGGTGLYFEALIQGLSTTPEIEPEVREFWRAQARDAPALHAELARRDPDMAARLRPSDTQRIVRALEVIDSTGISLARWQEQAGTPLIDPAAAAKFVLTVDRTALRERIAGRFAGMVENGALEEIRALGERNLAPSLPAMKAIGVVPLLAHLRGGLGRDEAIAHSITQTRQYAKRQETWFRNRLGDWAHLPSEAILAKF
ncbi:tRNA dimethylallyltransferase [Terrihabitans soli]|uniref:tRNA dimethylallyltransferase n=1 Tax=Terrihabitans soli TaxID=708113 RepID=A0A6S6QWH5_9HYPH|nr:tRNA (adenosine(37)-N6)-dimethylallyltransferase MiaA [Terrihabitans soli]BCJ91380.1 tRNA dimethylallyltransferase [Terrihabitans soli]